MLSRRGCVLDIANVPSELLEKVKKDLTVTPNFDISLGQFPKKIKMYVENKDKTKIAIPRFYASEHFETREDFGVVEKRPNMIFVGKLRKETKQDIAVRSVLDELHTVGGGVLCLQAGGGKTSCAINVACNLKVKTLVIVHKSFLADQWVERIQMFCPTASIGRIQGKVVDVENKDFVIGMVQSLSMKTYDPSLFEGIGMTVFDESHHCCAEVFSQTLFKVSSKYMLGLTATPERKDGLTRVLYWLFGRVVFQSERTDCKTTSVRTLYYMCDEYKQPPPENKMGKISMAAVITMISEIRERTDMVAALAVDLATKEKRKILILTDRRQQCKDLLEQIGKTFDSVGLYIGSMKQGDLEESNGKRIIISTYQMTKEGYDNPALDTLIMASSISDVNQAIGRIQRETPGKQNDPLVVDIVDKYCVFFAQYRKRCQFYKKSGFTMDHIDHDPPPKQEYAFLED